MIERRPFGRTGHLSTVTLFGGAALARASQADADRTLDLLLRYGVNHIDTAARYGDSELRIAPWMARHRKDFFLATKTGSRTASEAREDLHRSLERLRVDHVDLIQLHSLGHPDDWDQAMGPGGALEALTEAREEGLARYIGVTGHGWTIAAMHRRSLARFDFDAVLLPYNFFMAQQDRYRRDFEEVLSVCGAERRGSGHQVRRARAVGHRNPHAHHVVSAARGAGRHRPRGALGPRPARCLPEHGGRSDAASQSVGRREPFRAPPLRRRDGGGARLDADDVTVRARDVRGTGAAPEHSHWLKGAFARPAPAVQIFCSFPANVLFLARPTPPPPSKKSTPHATKSGGR